jgi:hypothetical protein
VLPFATVGQALIGAAGDWIGAEGAGEVRGLGHDKGLGIGMSNPLMGSGGST